MVKQRRRSAAAVGFQNIEVVPSEALETALRERQQFCKHGEAWARGGASDDPQKLKAFTGLWWDLSPQMRSWEVPPDDGSKCQKCKRTHRLGFYRGITYRDRCECNKGGRKIADEWKLLGYECYKRGLRERELLVNRRPWSSGRSPNLRGLGRRRGRCRTSTWGLCGLRQGRC